MITYYDILASPDIGGRAGMAYIKDYAELNLLPGQGWVKEWETKHFSLKNGEYTDCLPATIGCRLCSEKLRGLLEECKSEKDVLQWLDAEVESKAGEKRRYYILHFPVLEDLLDKKKSKYVCGNILTRHIINTKASAGHEVFSYVGGYTLSFVVSQRVREILKSAGCRGLIYLQISPKKKSYMPRIIRKFFRLLDNKSEQANIKRIKKQSKQVLDLSHLEGLNLPGDLIDFISYRRKLYYNEEKCSVGRVELVSIDNLLRGRIYVENSDSDQVSSKKGYYTIPAVDLIAECEGYDAWGILVWLPDIKMFGTWDCDHRKLRVFPKTKWSDIVKKPAKYLSAQWESEKVENEYFIPTEKYPFSED